VGKDGITTVIIYPVVKNVRALDPDLQEACELLVNQSKNKIDESGLEAYSNKKWFEQLDVDWDKYPNLRERLGL
jgi:hypothetical protein